MVERSIPRKAPIARSSAQSSFDSLADITFTALHLGVGESVSWHSQTVP